MTVQLLADRFRRAFGSRLPLLLAIAAAHAAIALSWLAGLPPSTPKPKTTLARLLENVDYNFALLGLALLAIWVVLHAVHRGNGLLPKVVALLYVVGGLASMWAFDVVLGSAYLAAGVQLYRYHASSTAPT
jgi:hypothetical protein